MRAIQISGFGSPEALQSDLRPGLRARRRFLEQVRPRTSPEGRAFLGFSDLGNREQPDRLARDAGLDVRTLRSFTAKTSAPLTYHLLELVRM